MFKHINTNIYRWMYQVFSEATGAGGIRCTQALLCVEAGDYTAKGYIYRARMYAERARTLLQRDAARIYSFEFNLDAMDAQHQSKM